METEQISHPAPPSVGSDIFIAEAEDQRAIGESLMDTLCFKYADMPAGKHIHVREQNVIGSLSIPQYVHIHQGNSPIVRTEYAEIQDIGLVSYRSLYTVIKVCTQTKPTQYSVTDRYEL